MLPFLFALCYNPVTLKRGLYLHIPFCHERCHYCDFVLTTNRTDTSRERFFSALEQEIRAARERYGKLRFDTLYFGGGTPSTLSPAEMTRIVKQLRDTFEFPFRYEFTCETNPEDVTEEKFRAYRDLGINRISLGAQSFNDSLLKAMGRNHDARQIEKALIDLRRAGFENVSLDLIIKLPGQTVQDVEHSLERAIAFKVYQVSVYDLDVHASTVYGDQARKGTLDLPGEETHKEMFEAVVNRLTANKYVQYELTNFAKPGFESEHNLIYWYNQEYLGLGPGAFSYLAGVRYQFALTLDRYLKKCEAGDWSRDVEDVISEEKKEIETLLTGLRLKEGVTLGQFKIIRDSLDRKSEELGDVLEKEEGRIRLSTRGRFVADSVLAQLISD